MKFTGLKDSKGIDIWEGDIISTKDAKCKVVFSDGCFLAYGWSGCLDEWKDIIEVIGNIYENPDLLFVLNTEEK